MTRRPINDAITGVAQIVTTKAIVEMLKSEILPFGLSDDNATTDPRTSTALPIPRSIHELFGQHQMHMALSCPHTAGLTSTDGFCDHFKMCCGADHNTAEVLSHALMWLLLKDRLRYQ